jgi:hypothetical protein
VIGEVHRRPPVPLVDHERRLEHRHLLDADPAGRCLQREDRARGAAEQERRAAALLDQRLDVLAFALDRVGGRVTARPAAPPVVVDDRVVRGEESGELPRVLPVRERCGDQDERRTRAALLERDRGAVTRGDAVFVDHVFLLLLVLLVVVPHLVRRDERPEGIGPCVPNRAGVGS